MKMMKLWMLVAVAALASACSKQDTEGFDGATAAKTIEFVATDAGGRTIFGEPDGNNYPVLWSAEDMVTVSLNMYDKAPATAVTPINNGASASFVVAYDEEAAAADAEKTFYAVVPNTGISGYYNNENDDPRFIIKLLAAQTPLADSCDPKAQILYAQSETYTDIPEQVALSFKHWCAYGCLTIKNLNTTEPIAKVQLTVDSYLAGSTYWRPTQENEVDRVYNIGGSPAPKTPEKTITLNTKSVENPLWFAVLPVDLSGEEFAVRVTLANGSYYEKTITFANGDGNFQAGKIAKFSVNFADVEKVVVAEPFQVLEVYKENDVAQGIVFWVSDDGQTAKIVSLDRCEASAWSSDNTTATGVTAHPAVTATADCAANMSAVLNWLKSNSEVEMKIVDFCKAKGEGWYWPAYNDLLQLSAAYNGVAKHSNVSNKYSGSSQTAPSSAEKAAQDAFEAALKQADPNADPINDYSITGYYTADKTKSFGDRYWACRESSGTNAFYVQYGYQAYSNASKKNKYYGRAVKIVTK